MFIPVVGSVSTFCFATIFKSGALVVEEVVVADATVAVVGAPSRPTRGWFVIPVPSVLEE